MDRQKMTTMTKKIKIQILDLYYECLLYDPLGYCEDKERIYYDILKTSLENNQKCGLTKNENGTILYIGGVKQER